MRQTVGRAFIAVQKAVVVEQRPKAWHAAHASPVGMRRCMLARGGDEREGSLQGDLGQPVMATVVGTRTHLRALAAASTSSSVRKTLILQRGGAPHTRTHGQGRCLGEGRDGASVQLLLLGLREELVRLHGGLVDGEAPARNREALEQHMQAPSASVTLVKEQLLQTLGKNPTALLRLGRTAVEELHHREGASGDGERVHGERGGHGERSKRRAQRVFAK